jgi:uncharacterized membrane protein YkoI
MKARILVTLALVAIGNQSEAQTSMRFSGGEVSRSSTRVDVTRLSPRVPGVDGALREQIHVSGDSAQRIAMNDFEWRGKVSSIEFDAADARVFWDVKIVPDTSQQTIVRYRVDATNGGILDIKEFSGVRGLARGRPK